MLSRRLLPSLDHWEIGQAVNAGDLTMQKITHEKIGRQPYTPEFLCAFDRLRFSHLGLSLLLISSFIGGHKIESFFRRSSRMSLPPRNDRNQVDAYPRWADLANKLRLLPA